MSSLALPSIADWQPATSITYNLKITRSTVTAEVSSISIWNGTTVDVDNGGEIAEGYKAEDVKIGDYYYDDGTWSDGGYRMLTDRTTLQYSVAPIEGKTCISIVYASGKTGEGREDNISKYSGTGIAAAAGIKGYVVRFNAEQGQRGGSGSNNVTAFNGYTNTKSLSTTTSNPRQLGAILLNTPPPAATSGWYVMSLGQTMYVYENRDIINASRSRVKTGSGYYGDMASSGLWTSTYGASGNFPTAFGDGSYGNAHGTNINSAYFSFTF